MLVRHEDSILLCCEGEAAAAVGVVMMVESALSEEEGPVNLDHLRPQEGGELSLAFYPLAEVPEAFAQRHGPFVYTLNLTETGIRSLETLRYFTHLKTLILDNNGLDRLFDCPKLDSVTTLWFNNNQVSDLPAFMDETIRCFPRLAYLSMMRNPAAPGLMDLVRPDLKACKLYRLYTLYRMPGLQVLDCTNVTDEERMAGKTRGQFAVKRKPAAAAAPPPSSSAPSPSHEDPFGDNNYGGGNSKNNHAAAPPPSAYLGVVRKKYDGRNSEGNRFISDHQL